MLSPHFHQPILLILQYFYLILKKFYRIVLLYHRLLIMSILILFLHIKYLLLYLCYSNLLTFYFFSLLLQLRIKTLKQINSIFLFLLIITNYLLHLFSQLYHLLLHLLICLYHFLSIEFFHCRLSRWLQIDTIVGICDSWLFLSWWVYRF